MGVVRIDRKMAAAGDDQPLFEKRITFDEFYAAYPRKRARKEAMKAWATISIEDRHKILPAIRSQKMSEDWRKDGGKFIPYPASWLRGERWDDELEADLGMGQCAWNVNGNRDGEVRCTEKGSTEKRGQPYCKKHAERIN